MADQWRRGRTWRLIVALVCWLSSTLAQLADDCPLGWEKHDYQCYRFVFHPAQTYSMAATDCQADGAYLLSVNSIDEHEFVSQWLTKRDLRRTNLWWTSGVGAGVELQWEGDGTTVSLDQGGLWPAEAGDLRQAANLHVVYRFTTTTNTFLWSRQTDNLASPYICEISLLEAFRISQAARDHSFGTDSSNPKAVPRGPMFTVEPKDMVVVGSLNLVFLECVASSNPPSSYAWIRVRTQGGEERVTTEMNPRYSLTNGRFSIQSPRENPDAGEYYCIARNQFGTIRSQVVSLSFGFLGEFSNDPPGAVRAAQYQGTYLECQPPLYNPVVTYEWYKGPGVNFLRTDLQQYQFVSYNGRLYFSETQQMDAGEYHCVVTLAPGLGQSVNTVQPPSAAGMGIGLIVKGDTATNFGPTIHNDFPAVFPMPALRGTNLRLECFAYGRLPLYYSWRRDNGPVPDKAEYQENKRVLVIPNGQLEDSGNYTCRVERGTRAWDEKTLSLNVEAVPFFIFRMRDQHVDIHTSFSLRCEAMGVPLPSYTWYKNGQILNSNPDDRLEVRGNVVTFADADPEKHSGMYECSASNNHGTKVTTAQVRVLEFKPNFSKLPLDSSQMATVGGNTTIVCQPEAAPTPTITWKQDGRDLGLTRGVEGRVMMLDNGNLYINQVQLTDQGEYTCTAENSKGASSSSGLLTVVTRTTITTPPKNTEETVNGTVFLLCGASFDQRHHDLIYVWAFNGYTIDIDNDAHFQRSQRQGVMGLYIINVQFIHQGWYECRAKTVDDAASARAYLTVFGPPSEPAGLHGKLERNDVMLRWTPGDDHGSDVIFYIIEFRSNFFPTWRVKVKELRAASTIDAEEGDKRSYRITDLSPGSSYNFRVRAVNQYGVGTASVASPFFTVPHAPPRVAPDGITWTVSTVGTLAITWNPLNPEDLTGRDKGYQLYWRKKTQDTVRDSLWQQGSVDSEENTFVTLVGSDNFYMEYEVKIAAFNHKGHGPNSSVAIVMSQEGLPIATPLNVWGEEFNSTAIMVYWDKVTNTRQYMKGTLLGFQINYWWEPDPGYLMSVNIYCGDCEGGMVLGLTPNEDYWVNVQVFNTAGLGPKGEDYRISTLLFPPLLYPEFVSVFSHEGNSVRVTWRGISISLVEEPLTGYKIRWWPATENILTANNTVIPEKRTWGVVRGVKKGIVYALRVLGYNAGGDGNKSPTVYFTLEGQVVYNPETTEILAAGSYVRVSIGLLVAVCLAHCALSILF